MSKSTIAGPPSGDSDIDLGGMPPPPKSESYWIAFAFTTLVASFLVTAAVVLALILFFHAGSLGPN